MFGSSKGACGGYRSGSLGRVLDRRDWGGAGAGRDGTVRDGAHGRVPAPGGACRPTGAAGGALLGRAAGVVRGDEGWVGVGGGGGRRSGARRDRDGQALGAVRAAGGRGLPPFRWTRGF